MSDSYGDVTAEYLALRRDCGLVTGLHEMVWVRGPDAVSFLDGLLSQAVASLEPGAVARSLLLEPRGRLRALLWVLRAPDGAALVADAGVAGDVVEDLTRFRFRVDVDLGSPVPVEELWGPRSATVLTAAGLPVPQGWATAGDTMVAGAPLGGLPRFFVTGAGPGALLTAGASPVGTLAATTVRIEAGEPRMGVDVDGSTIPQEAGVVAEAVDFDKGCYLGQELVARIDSRGHVNRHLRAVVLVENVLPPPSAEVVGGGRSLGTITSLGESLELRAPVGLALLRREADPGDPVEVRWDGGSARAVVAALPLDDFGQAPVGATEDLTRG